MAQGILIGQGGSPKLDGTATASNVLNGKTFYNTDSKTKLTGTMTNRGAVSASIAPGGKYTIPAGYHNGSGTVTATTTTVTTFYAKVSRGENRGTTKYSNEVTLNGEKQLTYVAHFGYGGGGIQGYNGSSWTTLKSGQHASTGTVSVSGYTKVRCYVTLGVDDGPYNHWGNWCVCTLNGTSIV